MSVSSVGQCQNSSYQLTEQEQQRVDGHRQGSRQVEAPRLPVRLHGALELLIRLVYALNLGGCSGGDEMKGLQAGNDMITAVVDVLECSAHCPGNLR